MTDTDATPSPPLRDDDPTFTHTPTPRFYFADVALGTDTNGGPYRVVPADAPVATVDDVAQISMCAKRLKRLATAIDDALRILGETRPRDPVKVTKAKLVLTVALYGGGHVKET